MISAMARNEGRELVQLLDSVGVIEVWEPSDKITAVVNGNSLDDCGDDQITVSLSAGADICTMSLASILMLAAAYCRERINNSDRIANKLQPLVSS